MSIARDALGDVRWEALRSRSGDDLPVLGDDVVADQVEGALAGPSLSVVSPQAREEPQLITRGRKAQIG